jgi:hypothetical protein
MDVFARTCFGVERRPRDPMRKTMAVTIAGKNALPPGRRLLSSFMRGQAAASVDA